MKPLLRVSILFQPRRYSLILSEVGPLNGLSPLDFRILVELPGTAPGSTNAYSATACSVIAGKPASIIIGHIMDFGKFLARNTTEWTSVSSCIYFVAVFV